ncbi:hypothetical protein CapIbe_023480 [Capra ibex]
MNEETRDKRIPVAAPGSGPLAGPEPPFDFPSLPLRIVELSQERKWLCTEGELITVCSSKTLLWQWLGLLVLTALTETCFNRVRRDFRVLAFHLLRNN